MEYYSPIKRNTFKSVRIRLINLEPIIQSEVTQKEKSYFSIIYKQISYINMYVRNLERWYWWTYFQVSSGGEEIENRLADTQGEGQGAHAYSFMERVSWKHKHYHMQNR